MRVYTESHILFSTAEEAELGKIFHNGFNAAKISFFNQAGRMASAVAAEIGRHVSMSKIQGILPISCEGLWNPRYGTISGAPFGGHCLPKDCQALASLEAALLTNADDQPEPCPRFFGAVVEVNRCMVNSAVMPDQLLQSLPANSEVANHAGMPIKTGAQRANALEVCAGLHLLDVPAKQSVLAECNTSHPPLQLQ